MPGSPRDAALTTRRSFLHFLLGGPLFASSAAGAAERLLAVIESRDPIAAAEDAINAFDLRAAAERNLSQAHWDYLSLGVGDEVTLRENREAFARVQLRPRRLVDTRDVDPSTSLGGTPLASPIVLAPCGAQKAFHPEGELAVARAAREGDHLQILSTGSSSPIEAVAAARGDPIWFQLYATRVFPATRWMLRSAEEVGCPAVVLTVDIVGGGENRDRINRHHRWENPACDPCHATLSATIVEGAARAANAVGIDPFEVLSDLMVLDWDFVDRVRDATTMDLWIKGILTAEDAERCIEHGVDGIVVSNHGGRAEDVGLATIEALPEIAAAVKGRIPLLVDSGFRRGTDVFKGLALGASAVAVGRPYLWGLSAFGREGVEVLLRLLRRELAMSMKAMGTPDVAAITSERVRIRGERG